MTYQHFREHERVRNSFKSIRVVASLLICFYGPQYSQADGYHHDPMEMISHMFLSINIRFCTPNGCCVNGIIILFCIQLKISFHPHRMVDLIFNRTLVLCIMWVRRTSFVDRIGQPSINLAVLSIILNQCPINGNESGCSKVIATIKAQPYHREGLTVNAPGYLWPSHICLCHFYCNCLVKRTTANDQLFYGWLLTNTSPVRNMARDKTDRRWR